MAKKSNASRVAKDIGFKVPESEREAYKLLVQDANRTLQRNLKYIKENKIKDFDTKRALVHSYGNKRNWAKSKTGKTAKNPLSRSIKFKSEQDYKDYVHHLEKITKRKAKKLEQGYKATIKDRLQRISNIYGVQLPNNKLDSDITNAIDNMSLPQLKNWFEIGDPEEDMEVSEYGSDDFIGVDTYDDFKDITLKRLGWLKKAY